MYNFNTFLLQRQEPKADDLPPADITMLDRLIHMRLEQVKKCGCNRCTDLLTLIHNNCEALVREHNAERWSLRYWANPLHDAVAHKPAPNGAVDKLRMEDINQHQGCIDSLIEAERQWQRGILPSCSHEDSDDFWISEYNEVKRRCDELKKSMEQGDATERLLDGKNDEAEEGAKLVEKKSSEPTSALK